MDVLVDEEVGGVALYRGGQRQDDLLDTAGVHSVKELLDGKLLDANAVHRGNDAAQDVVNTLVLMRVLYGDDITDVLHHADDPRVALRVGADVAEVVIGDVVALPAENHIALELVDAVGEQRHVGFVLLDEVQGESQRRPLADAGELGNLVDSIL